MVVLACATAHGQVKLDIYSNGKKAGTGSFGYTLAGGNKTIELKMNIDQGQRTSMLIKTLVDAKGARQREEFVTVPTADQSMTVRIATLFSTKAANVQITYGGKNLKRVINLPKDATTRNDPSEWWFITNVPKVGDSASYYSFSNQSLAWDITKVKFLGKKPVKLGSKTVQGNHLEQTQRGLVTNIYLDDKGLPLLIESPALKLVRQG
jgi:hypothetical protein